MKTRPALLPLAILLGVAFTARASTLTVSNLNDSGAGSLRQALADASPDDTIVFDGGLAGTIALSSGELVVATNVTIDGPGSDVIEVSGGDAMRVFNITGGSVLISGLTMTDGRHQGADGFGGMQPDAGRGGAIFNAATLGLTECVISSSTANGGQNFDPGQAGEGQGGGIANTGSLNMTNCLVESNQARGGNGTSMGHAGDGRGGGIYSDGELVLYRCTVYANSAIGGLAGGGGGGGGGSNGLAQGGGLWSIGPGSTVVTLCTFAANFVNSPDNGRGGGLEPGNPTTIHSCTITDNNGQTFGGGISAGAGVTIVNSIVALNQANSGPDVSGTVTSSGYNLVGVFDGSSGWSGTGDQTGTKSFPLDPMLGGLEDNGGSTRTYALRWGSPAMDKGKSSGVAIDQRGEARYDDPTLANASGGGGSDIGAYEAAELRIVHWAKLGDDFNLGHTSVRDVDYQILSRAEMPTGGWITNLDNVPGNGGINQVTLTNMVTGAERYFRVKRLP